MNSKEELEREINQAKGSLRRFSKSYNNKLLNESIERLQKRLNLLVDLDFTHLEQFHVELSSIISFMNDISDSTLQLLHFKRLKDPFYKRQYSDDIIFKIENSTPFEKEEKTEDEHLITFTDPKYKTWKIYKGDKIIGERRVVGWFNTNFEELKQEIIEIKKMLVAGHYEVDAEKISIPIPMINGSNTYEKGFKWKICLYNSNSEDIVQEKYFKDERSAIEAGKEVADKLKDAIILWENLSLEGI